MKDVRFGTPYAYSVLAPSSQSGIRKAYQLGTVLEESSAYDFGPVPLAYAATEASAYTAYVKGNYNGMLSKISSGSNCVTLALPSIMLGWIPPSGKIEDAGSGSLVISGKKNYPASYS